MKNLSFWNQIAGAKGKAVVCTAAAASLAVLLFVVCSNNSTNPPPPPPPGTTGYCRLFGDPAQCPQIGGGNEFATDDAKCAASGGFVVTSCTTAPTTAECAKYPNASGCSSVPPIPPGTPGYCRLFGDPAQCPQIGGGNQYATDDATCATNGGFVVASCTAPPSATECATYQTAAGCQSIPPCPPTQPGCPGYVEPSCPPTQLGCPGYDECLVDPNLPQCAVENPCANGISMACCAANPGFDPECPNYCSVNPSAPQCADLCATNPTPDCPNYCTVYPSASGCLPPGPCDAGVATAACCAEIPTYPGCVTDQKYCYWGPEKCYPLNTPDAVDPNSDEGLTFLKNCQSYGFVSSSSTCADAPTVEYYCQWPTGCYRIANPDAVDPNATGGKTYLENCKANGKVVDKATCDAWKPPAVQEFCNYGTCVDGNGWGCDGGGGCYRLGDEGCKDGKIVSECPAGTKPPSADY